MRVIVGALYAGLLAGCVTPAEEINGARDSWRGAHYADVVARWGVPSRSMQTTDRVDVHTWLSQSASGGGSAFYPSIGIFGGSRGVGVGVGTGISIGQSTAGGVTVHCERALFFRDDQLVDQRWEGNADYCSTFRRY